MAANTRGTSAKTVTRSPSAIAPCHATDVHLMSGVRRSASGARDDVPRMVSAIWSRNFTLDCGRRANLKIAEDAGAEGLTTSRDR
jgi:hypothetical protein